MASERYLVLEFGFELSQGCSGMATRENGVYICFWHYTPGCEYIFYVGYRAVVHVLYSSFRWEPLGYSGLLKWVSVQKV